MSSENKSAAEIDRLNKIIGLQNDLIVSWSDELSHIAKEMKESIKTGKKNGT